MGALTAAAATPGALTHLVFDASIDQRPVARPVHQAVAAHGERWGPVLEQLEAELEQYFDGCARCFGIAVAPQGTVFQRRVWQALMNIGFGQTLAYSALANRLGLLSGARAVGAANGRNPLSIIVPCHRLVAASGALTGYAGGLAAKRWLLDHEAGG
ncbi:MAG: methylated-DNA--[protein]-cysteine S-methyltransferase [Gammaproteobacteria bacterium]|nr:methylated-DNA--[protein]-cysteine S-methyltransferase [Gammaproteobacteria bacterium]